VPRNSTKVYKKVQVSNMREIKISRCPNKAMGSTYGKNIIERRKILLICSRVS
jgi:hypothetical protein